MTALQLSELYELDVRAAPPAAPVASPAPMALVMAIPTATPGTAAATAPATVATTPVPMPVETIAVWMLESLVHALTCEAFAGVTGTIAVAQPEHAATRTDETRAAAILT
jgi:hypothetical protein